jgi:hypothetical protein
MDTPPYEDRLADHHTMLTALPMQDMMIEMQPNQ